MNIAEVKKADFIETASKRRSFVRVVPILVIVLLISLCANAVLAWRMMRLKDAVNRLQTESLLNAGAIVPQIKAKSIDGRTATIRFEDSDRPTLLYFFSPGCETCERNVRNIKVLAEQKSADYRVIGFSLTDEGLEQYVREKEINFPVYSGLGVETTLAYKLGRVPQTTIVSPDGKALANWHGPFDGRQRLAIEDYFGIKFSQ